MDFHYSVTFLDSLFIAIIWATFNLAVVLYNRFSQQLPSFLLELSQHCWMIPSKNILPFSPSMFRFLKLLFSRLGTKGLDSTISPIRITNLHTSLTIYFLQFHHPLVRNVYWSQSFFSYFYQADLYIPCVLGNSLVRTIKDESIVGILLLLYLY